MGGLAIGLAVLGMAWPVAADAAMAARPAVAVSLGDSFISGEGGRWLGNGSSPFGDRSGTDRAAFGCGAWGCSYDPARVYGASERSGCHRSDVAPIVSAPLPVGRRVNLACSGARLVNLLPAAAGGEGHFGERPQVDALAALAGHADVALVVVTAGANDVGFGKLVARCALDWARSDESNPALCRRRSQARVAAALPAMRRGLTRVLRSVRAALAAAGQPPRGYRLIVAGYASPFPPGSLFRYPEAGWSRLGEGGCPVWNDDADWAAGPGTGAIVAAMAEAAATTGAELLDLREAFAGHQLCDRRAERIGPHGPTAARAEWFRRLAFVQGSGRESLHPNAYGQQAMGTCIALHFERPRGDYACRATPGAGLEGMRVEDS